MPVGRDVKAIAKVMIHVHGQDAHIEACRQLDDMIDRGDPDDIKFWAEVVSTIAALRPDLPTEARPR